MVVTVAIAVPPRCRRRQHCAVAKPPPPPPHHPLRFNCRCRCHFLSCCRCRFQLIVDCCLCPRHRCPRWCLRCHCGSVRRQRCSRRAAAAADAAMPPNCRRCHQAGSRWRAAAAAAAALPPPCHRRRHATDTAATLPVAATLPPTHCRRIAAAANALPTPPLRCLPLLRC